MSTHGSTLGILVLLCWLGQAPASQSNGTLVVGTLMIEPFLMKSDSATGYEGFIPDLMDALTAKLNLDYTFDVRDDSVFGFIDDNGTWGGLIGDVISKKIDVAAAPLTETAARRSAVDFSTPFMSFGSVVIMKKPQTVIMTIQERFKRLLSPLSEGVWLMSGLAWLVTSAVLYIICRVDPYEWRRLCRDRQATMREGESFTCPNTFWFTLSTVLWQGYTRAPRSLGARTVVMSWWTFVLIFIVMYIASMTNFLRVGPTEGRVDAYGDIQTMKDLADQPRVTYGVLKNGASMQYLLNSQEKKLRQMGKTIRNKSWYTDSVQEGIQNVRDTRKSGAYAFITESAMARFYAGQRPCDVYMLSDFTATGSYSLAMPFNMGLKKDVDVALLELRENGVLKQLTDRWFTGVCSEFLMDSTHNSKMQEPPFYKVDLGSFSGALILLAGGIILGSLATLVEVLVFKRAEKEEQEDKKRLKPPVRNIQYHDEVGPMRGDDLEPVTDV